MKDCYVCKNLSLQETLDKIKELGNKTYQSDLEYFFASFEWNQLRWCAARHKRPITPIMMTQIGCMNSMGGTIKQYD